MRRLTIITLLIPLFLMACSPANTPVTPAGEVNSQPEAVENIDPVWQTLPLVNARTGETFTLADFAGKTVFVETMATWCGNCRLQLTNVRDARTQLGEENYVFIGLSVETSLSGGDLAAYADDAGFEWVFAVLTPEALAALSETFGRTITNPPTTPHFIIYPDGSASELHAGTISSTEQLVEQLTAASES